MKSVRVIEDSSIFEKSQIFNDAVENDREPTKSGREALKIQKLICEIYDQGIKSFERNSY